MKAQLLCRLRGGSTQTFNVRGEASVIGRDPGIAVSVAMEGISRRHAQIRFDGKVYWIEDLTSTNGTFLNGRPVRKERLRHLDVITLGRKADLLFVLRSEEQQVVKRKGIVRAALVAESPDSIPYEVPVGETTLGRSSVCNVRVESTTASKMHAHVRRSVDQLVVQDLGSSNGTFVNGQRVNITELHDGDLLSLGGVETYKVVVEVGQVTTSSGQHALPIADAVPAPARPRFSNAWRTRFEWDPDELKVIAEVQAAGLASRRESTARPKDKPQGTRPPQPAAAVKARPAAKPPPTKAPAATTAAKPVPATKPPLSEPKTVVPTAPAKPPAGPAAPARGATPPAAAAAPTSKPAASPAPAESSPRPEPTVADRVPGFVAAHESPASTTPARIVELRLRGGAYDLVVSESGAHSLGRATDAPLRVDHPTVSRKHARIILSDDRSVAYLQDLGGANGTLLNGVALQELKPLKEGDRIRVGQVDLTVSFKKA